MISMSQWIDEKSDSINLANAGVEYMVSASERVRVPAHLIYFSWDPLTDFVAN